MSAPVKLYLRRSIQANARNNLNLGSAAPPHFRHPSLFVHAPRRSRFPSQDWLCDRTLGARSAGRPRLRFRRLGVSTSVSATMERDTTPRVQHQINVFREGRERRRRTGRYRSCSLYSTSQVVRGEELRLTFGRTNPQRGTYRLNAVVVQRRWFQTPRNWILHETHY